MNDILGDPRDCDPKRGGLSKTNPPNESADGEVRVINADGETVATLSLADWNFDVLKTMAELADWTLEKKNAT